MCNKLQNSNATVKYTASQFPIIIFYSRTLVTFTNTRIGQPA